ncbi:MAG: hypothetical protein P8009_05405 [Gammaproteobacteria bacterium]
MKVRESFYRPDAVLGREPWALAAGIYNRTYLLLRHCGEDCLFVPIRSMQYLAVVDAEEIIFVDGNRRHYIELAWQGFRPQTRAALDEAVPFEVVYYLAKGRETMQRLVGEFASSIRLLGERTRPETGAADLVELPRTSR